MSKKSIIFRLVGVFVTVAIVIFMFSSCSGSKKTLSPKNTVGVPTSQIGDSSVGVVTVTALPGMWLQEKIPLKKGWSFSVKTLPRDYRDVAIRVISADGEELALRSMKEDFHFKQFPSDVDLFFDVMSLESIGVEVIVRQFP